MMMQLNHLQFTNVEFYEDFDAADLSVRDIETHYEIDHSIERSKYEKWFPYNTPRVLGLPEISLTIKHYQVYKKIAEGNDEVALILEDDSVIDNDFVSKFFEYYNETPEFDIVLIASCCGLHGSDKIYRKDHPATRCTGAMLVTKKACADLVKTFLPFHLCIDWELNYQMWLHNHKVFWWEPSMIKQGSEIGLFKSALR
jgi:hypothetical protein